MRFRMLRAVAVAAMVAALTAVSLPAEAAAPAVSETQQSINDVLQRNPGARQLDATTVQVKEGVTFRARAVQCPARELCIWSGLGRTGLLLSFRVCRFEDIGLMWGNDRMRSLENNQTPGRVSRFYNWLNPGWGQVGTSTAYNLDVAVSTAKRTTEGIQVC